MQSGGRNAEENVLRAAFTLIEMLLVMAIIAVLAGLLLAAFGGVRDSARIAEVTSEISVIEKALQDFELEFGVGVPSSFIIHETGTGWSNNDQYNALRRYSRAFLARLWPDYNFAGNFDINKDGDTGDTLVMNGAECMVFFLGGVYQRASGNVACLGFSKNPANPYAVGGTRRGPYMEFDSLRLVDRDSDGIPEYLDTLPGQQTPYFYFSSYDGNGYRLVGRDGAAGRAGADDDSDSDTDYEGGMQANGPDLSEVGSPNTDDEAAQGLSIVTPYIDGAGRVYRPKGYQIISAGFDNSFGQGGRWVEGEPIPEARRDERDNITNFAGRALDF